MFKKSDGSVGFSWGRWVVNSIPVFTFDNKDGVDLSPARADALFKWQLTTENPRLLGRRSFLVAGVVGKSSLSHPWSSTTALMILCEPENEPHSQRILTALHKNGILSPTDPRINTDAISKHFANQLAVISVHAQRRLIGMLFAWDEELTRWRLLDDEEREIQALLMDIVDKQHDARPDLETALESVRIRRSLAPSARMLSQQQDGAADTEFLPAYSK